MYRMTLLAAAILTAAPLAAQAQDGYDYKAMDEARRAANHSVRDLTADINSLSHRLSEINTELETTYRTYGIRLSQFDHDDRRTLSEKRSRLVVLGPETPFRAPAYATDAERRRLHDRWVAANRERRQLNEEVAVLEARQHALDVARKEWEQKSMHISLVQRRFNELKHSRNTRAIDFMIEEGRKHGGWTRNILQLRYPELFR